MTETETAPMLRVGVIGAGSWGTALAYLLADKGYPVTLWAYETDVVESVNTDHENRLFLDGIRLPDNLVATGDLEQACRDKDLILCVTPSHIVRRVMSRAAAFLPDGVPIVSATKGIENDSLMTVSEVLEEVLPIRFHPWLAYLSGPSFAREVAQHVPTAVVVASYSEKLSRQVQLAFNHDYFRVYRSHDVVGVEVGGSLKNVIAIAAGIADGMGFGYNARAAIITRGLAEMSRMAVAKGANPLTLAGLSGMGDLVLTCTGGLSRNRQVGMKLGEGASIESILADMSMVAEGVKTAQSVHDLSRKMGVEMPICDGVYSILYEGKTARQALLDLMGRELKRESFGF
jgi:glycerol-3-phosphate dehydrogenase (NAD(P)+)